MALNASSSGIKSRRSFPDSSSLLVQLNGSATHLPILGSVSKQNQNPPYIRTDDGTEHQAALDPLQHKLHTRQQNMPIPNIWTSAAPQNPTTNSWSPAETVPGPNGPRLKLAPPGHTCWSASGKQDQKIWADIDHSITTG